jgi:predicted acyl esterase
VRDALTHPYLAGHGYACVRVDMRGSGDSDG